jgi:sugar lactone lactonase YvrE
VISKYVGYTHVVVLLLIAAGWGQTGIVNTFAGGGSALRNNVSAREASLCNPLQTAVNSSSDIYLTSFCQHVVYRFDHATNRLSIVAGDGTQNSLLFPMGVVLDKADNLYIIDGSKIRRLDAQTQTLSVIASDLNGDYGIAIDGAGNLFFADGFGNHIRRWDAISKTISTVAGNGTQSFSGDNGPALNAALNFPLGVVLDQFGNLFFSDSNNNRVRRVDAATGIITTVAGGGTGCASQTDVVGDGCAATAATLQTPFGLAIDGLGNLVIGDGGNNRVRRVDKTSGAISTVAGNGKAGYSGNYGPAVEAKLFNPSGVAFDHAGNLLIGDAGNNRVRRVDAVTGIIKDFAGNGGRNFISDNVPAAGAAIAGPAGIAVDKSGNVYFFDTGNNRVRRIDRGTGIITTIAGNGTAGYSGDGKVATSAQIYAGNDAPNGIAFDKTGNLFIADTGNNRIRRVDAVTHVITTVAGNGIAGFSEDGIRATLTKLDHPPNVAFDNDGNLLIVDGFLTARVRRVDATTHVITTVAGGGEGCPEQTGPRGDGCVATSATLAQPFAVALDAAGNMYITEQLHVRRVDAVTKIITTVAGNGNYGSRGDNGLALDARLSYPYGIIVDGLGSLVLADTGNNRVRRVNPWSQLILRVAGGGSGCASQTDAFGDGCKAPNAIFNYVTGVALDSSRHLFISDYLNDRIRDVPLLRLPTTTMLESSQNPAPLGQSVTFTATVSWAGGAARDGDLVKFVSGTKVYGTVPLKGGAASLAISTLPVGTSSVQAIYEGDADLYGSRNTVLQQTN